MRGRQAADVSPPRHDNPPVIASEAKQSSVESLPPSGLLHQRQLCYRGFAMTIPPVIASEAKQSRRQRFALSHRACENLPPSGLLHQRQLCCRGFAMTIPTPVPLTTRPRKALSGPVCACRLPAFLLYLCYGY
ncbi:MAG: hypothetical protein LBT00_03280 [Spirochaetaceae bacterium]|nr:hypothetical protein [Spirochaetaceae bacterium]